MKEISNTENSIAVKIEQLGVCFVLQMSWAIESKIEELHPAAPERSATSGSQGLLSSSYIVNLMIFGAFLL